MCREVPEKQSSRLHELWPTPKKMKELEKRPKAKEDAV